MDRLLNCHATRYAHTRNVHITFILPSPPSVCLEVHIFIYIEERLLSGNKNIEKRMVLVSNRWGLKKSRLKVGFRTLSKKRLQQEQFEFTSPKRVEMKKLTHARDTHRNGVFT